MTSNRKDLTSETPESQIPLYGKQVMAEGVPRTKMPEKSMDPKVVQEWIRAELKLEGNPALNMASFVTTTMDEEAKELIVENLGRNFIDTEVYRRSLAMEEYCVRMLADLYNCPEGFEPWGTDALGSSEALMLAALSHKWSWRIRRQKEGKPYDRPNIIMGNNVHITWEKYAKYFEVEAKIIPLQPDRFIITGEEVKEAVDENTTCVVAVLGTSYTGQFDPVEEINDALLEIKQEKGWDIPLHVDAASGGFVAPFIFPDLKWDFRLPQVKSINVSGHKFGLVYPGIGWTIWKDKNDIPKGLFSTTNVLGFEETTYGLNFSRGSAMVLGQYYNFLRFGKEGYRRIFENNMKTAKYLADGLLATGRFELANDLKTRPCLPAVVLKLKNCVRFNVADLSARLKENGWIVPAFSMPPNANSVDVVRMVIKENFTRDMADLLIEDVKSAIDQLDKTQTEPILPRPCECGVPQTSIC